MIESIAVLAVIAILAALIAPSFIKQVDRAAWTKETAELNAIGDALTQSIVRTKTIPSQATWAAAVASQMSLPVSAVLTNARRYARAFVIDQDLTINGNGLPYTQTSNGTTNVTKARVMILSSLAGPPPLPSGVQSSSDFDQIWNAPEGGDDLRIKKLNLEPLFHQLILFNHDPTNAPPGPFSFDGGTTNFVSSRTGWNRYYLESSDLWLYDADLNVRTRYLTTRSISFIFESGVWRGQRGGETLTATPPSETGTNFLSLASAFYSAPVNPGAGAGSSQSSVLVTMYTFMFDYVFWATQCPSFDWHGNDGGTPSNLPEYRMLNDTGQSGAGVDKYSGAGGLLK